MKRSALGKVLFDGCMKVGGRQGAAPTQNAKTFSMSLAILLAFALLFTLSSCSPREKQNNMEFRLDPATDTYTLTYYTDTAGVKELIIPDTFNGVPVTAIGQLAIGSCDTLERIVVGGNIVSIDKWGITDCRYLRRIEVDEKNEHFVSLDGVLYTRDMETLVTYPNAHTAVYAEDGRLLQKASYSVAPGTKAIGHSAFYKCYGLESVALPEGVETIEAAAFHKCEALTGINLPEGLRFIGKDAFHGCEGLTELTLPSTIREIETYAFYKCPNFTELRVRAKEADVTLGDKWFPTDVGREYGVKILWGWEG